MNTYILENSGLQHENVTLFYNEPQIEESAEILEMGPDEFIEQLQIYHKGELPHDIFLANGKIPKIKLNICALAKLFHEDEIHKIQAPAGVEFEMLEALSLMITMVLSRRYNSKLTIWTDWRFGRSYLYAREGIHA